MVDVKIEDVSYNMICWYAVVFVKMVASETLFIFITLHGYYKENVI